jgi:nucleotide-binding universal stress UspA family protein
MELPLVVGVDGSDSSLRATDWAADEAVRRGLPLRLVYASLWERYEPSLTSADRPAERVQAQNIVGSAAHRVQAHAPEVKVTTDVLPQDAVAALLSEGRHATAVVTGSRGRGEVTGLLLGSVGLAVAARAQCPVIVVRGDETALAGRHERILLGIGDGDHDSPAVHFAFEEATRRGCALDVVRAWRRPFSEGVADTGRATPTEDPGRGYREQAAASLDDSIDAAAHAHPNVRVRKATVEGPAHRVLPARTAAADLVVVGARRRQSQFGMQLGRVSHRILHHALCPVAVVPQPY